VLAVAVADVLVRDLHPGVALGFGDHPLDQASVAFLHVGAARDLRLRLADADQQSVTDPLQLDGAEDARSTDGADGPVDALAREGRGPKLRELLLKARDLAAELVAKRSVIRRDQVLQRSTALAASDFIQVVLERLSHTFTFPLALSTS